VRVALDKPAAVENLYALGTHRIKGSREVLVGGLLCFDFHGGGLVGQRPNETVSIAILGDSHWDLGLDDGIDTSNLVGNLPGALEEEGVVYVALFVGHGRGRVKGGGKKTELLPKGKSLSNIPYRAAILQILPNPDENVHDVIPTSPPRPHKSRSTRDSPGISVKISAFSPDNWAYLVVGKDVETADDLDGPVALALVLQDNMLALRISRLLDSGAKDRVDLLTLEFRHRPYPAG